MLGLKKFNFPENGGRGWRIQEFSMGGGGALYCSHFTIRNVTFSQK